MNSLDGKTRLAKNYIDRLKKYHKRSGVDINHPSVGGTKVNFLRLRNLVESKGGYGFVSEKKLWNLVCYEMNLPPQNLGSSKRHSLKTIYEKWILPFENFLSNQTKQMDKFTKEVDINNASNFKSIVALPKKIDTSLKSPEKSDHETENIFSSSTESPLTPLFQNHIKTLNLIISSDEESEPEDVKRVKLSAEDNIFDLTGEEVYSSLLQICLICQKGKDFANIILCEGCDDPYHVYCIEKPPKPMETEWSCAKCITSTPEDYGFEEGKTYSLYDFQQFADEFKRKYFKSQRVSELEAEIEFWKIIENPFNEVEVEYGADIQTQVNGSGFPIYENDPLNPYSKDAWNLNNIPIFPGSILKNLRADIPGLMIPWLYIGMVFSTFCWHAEDHFAYSINYHHWGETKTWYGIPSTDAEIFENVMRHELSELFKSSPDLLFHITTMISPKKLAENNIKVYGCNQRPGEFVITFPRAYHSGFNHGFNCAEAVNFALPDWLPYGERCVALYRQFCKQPIFSHDQLLIMTAKEYNGSFILLILESLQKLIENETKLRKIVINLSDIDVMYGNSCQFDEEQCAICKTFCYLSSLTDTDNKIYCLEHANQSLTPRKVLLRYSLEELHTLSKNVMSRAYVPIQWGHTLDVLIQNKPSLIELSNHLEKAKFYHPKKAYLQEIIAKCNFFTSQANDLATGKFHHTVSDVKQLIQNIESFLDFTAPELNSLKDHLQVGINLNKNLDHGIQINQPDVELRKILFELNSAGFIPDQKNEVLSFFARG